MSAGAAPSWRRERRVRIAAIVINLIGQAVLLAALAWWGEWRVWRFMANVTADLDAAILLVWMFRQLLRGRSPQRSP